MESFIPCPTGVGFFWLMDSGLNSKPHHQEHPATPCTQRKYLFCFAFSIAVTPGAKLHCASICSPISALSVCVNNHIFLILPILGSHYLVASCIRKVSRIVSVAISLACWNLYCFCSGNCCRHITHWYWRNASYEHSFLAFLYSCVAQLARKSALANNRRIFFITVTSPSFYFDLLCIILSCLVVLQPVGTNYISY